MAVAVVRFLRRQLDPAATDAELLAAYAERRCPDAFRALVERHGPRVHAACRRALGDPHAADDAFQATFLILARNARSVRRPAALGAWLHAVAGRVGRRARAVRARRRAAEAQAVVPPKSSDPAGPLSARELLAALDGELARLPERYRLPVWLVYWQGLTHADAARRLGWSAGAFHGRLERGRRRLAERLARRGLAPSALLLAAADVVAVPSDLLVRTAALSAAPWSRTLPTAVAGLAATSTLPKTVAGVIAIAVGLGVMGFADGPGPIDPPAQPPATVVGVVPRVDQHGDALPAGAVMRFGTPRFSTRGRAFQPVRWPGRDQVTVGTGTSLVTLDLHTGRIVRDFGRFTRTVNGRERPVMTSAWALAPDGRTFVVGGRDQTPGPVPFWLCDATTGARLREFAGHDKLVTALAFRPDGREAVSLGGDSTVRVWATGTGEKLREWTAPNVTLTSLALAPDGGTAATGGDARGGPSPVFLWDVATGDLRRTLTGHTAPVRVVAFSPDGRMLASGGNAAVRLWDVTTGRELRQLTGHAPGQAGIRHFLKSLAFSPDGGTLASAGTDGTVRVWDVTTGRAIDQFEESIAEAHALGFLDDRTLIIGGGPKLLFRDVRERRFPNRADGHGWGIAGVAVAPGGRSLTTVGHDSSVRIWDTATGRFRSAPTGGPADTNACLAPDGRRMAVTEQGTGELVVRIDDLTTGREIRRLPDKGHFTGGTFSADGRRLATRTVNGPAAVWDIATGAKLGQFPVVPWMGGADVVFAPDGRSVFASERNGIVAQWDAATGNRLREFEWGNANALYALAVSLDGRHLAIGWPGELAVGEVATGRRLWQADRQRPPFAYHALAFSPDSSLLAAGVAAPDGRQVFVWDVRTGRLLGGFAGHEAGVTALAFFPDGRRLVSGSTDTTALAWDLRSLVRDRPAD